MNLRNPLALELLHFNSISFKYFNNKVSIPRQVQLVSYERAKVYRYAPSNPDNLYCKEIIL